MDYQKAYALLVGIMSNAIDEISKSYVISQEMENAIRMLKEGLGKSEEMYICSDESVITVLEKSKTDNSGGSGDRF